jgi:hypothetical protein
MESFKKWFSQDIPAGWGELLVRSVKVFVVAFLILQLKEFIDAGSFDTPATAIDSALIAAGTLVLNAILMRLRPSPQLSQHQPLMRQ